MGSFGTTNVDFGDYLHIKFIKIMEKTKKIVKTKAKGLCTDKGGEGKEKSINLFNKGGQYVRGI
jgi:hypothetical protein